MKPAQRRIDAGMWWDKGPTVVKGCTVVSPGCANCWAAGLDHRFGFGNTTKKGKWSGRIQTDITALEKAVRGKPKVITIWNDLFHPDVPDHFIGDALNIMLESHYEQKGHLFLVLSKRPERMVSFFKTAPVGGRIYGLPVGEVKPLEGPLPPNVWLGTSVESQDHVDRLTWLMKTPAAKRFVSLEPMLGEVGLREWLFYDDGPACCDGGTQDNPCGCHGAHQFLPVEEGGIDFVIVGAESGPKRRPCDIEWIRGVVQDCQAAGVPVWVKQIHDAKGKVTHKLEEFPEDLRLRQWPEGR